MSEGRLALNYLGTEPDVVSGDLVVTSGLAGYYPSQLVIGYVEEIRYSPPVRICTSIRSPPVRRSPPAETIRAQRKPGSIKFSAIMADKSAAMLPKSYVVFKWTVYALASLLLFALQPRPPGSPPPSPRSRPPPRHGPCPC